MALYHGKAAGVETAIQVADAAPGRYRVTLGGETIEVDAVQLPRGTLSMLINGHVSDIDSEFDGDTIRMLNQGRYTAVQLVSDRVRRLQGVRGAGGGDGPVNVVAPMPGRVVRLLAAVGDAVRQGQPVAVVEAMKMENEMKAPRAGKVAQILVAPGQAVERQAKLLVIE